MQQQLSLNFKAAVLATDNFVIRGLSTGAVDLLFTQVTKEEPGQMEADVVAAVRLTSMAQLENLKQTIEEHIKKEQEREA